MTKHDLKIYFNMYFLCIFLELLLSLPSADTRWGCWKCCSTKLCSYSRANSIFAFMCSVGDKKHLSENTVCCAAHRIRLRVFNTHYIQSIQWISLGFPLLWNSVRVLDYITYVPLDWCRTRMINRRVMHKETTHDNTCSLSVSVYSLPSTPLM